MNNPLVLLMLLISMLSKGRRNNNTPLLLWLMLSGTGIGGAFPDLMSMFKNITSLNPLAPISPILPQSIAQVGQVGYDFSKIFGSAPIVPIEKAPTYSGDESPLGVGGPGGNYDPYGGLDPNIYGYGD